MKITRLHFSESGLLNSLLPYLEGRVFHVTKESYLDSILECGEIRPNKDGSYDTTFGSSTISFFRKRGCVSLFDFRSATQKQLDMFLGRCSPTQPASPEDGIAILFLNDSIYQELLPWTMRKEEEAYREMILPYLEAGYPGPIAVEKVDEIIIVSVVEDPESFVSVLRRLNKKKAKGC
jgi:hypothetical protein